MPDNVVIILNSLLEHAKNQTAPDMAESDFFEVFTFEQVLKNYDLSTDELTYGKVGGRADGGIDGFFTFVNGELFKDAGIEPDALKRKPLVEVFLIQATRSRSFSESTINSANATVTDIYNFDTELSEFESIYNGELLDRASVFRDIYMKLTSRHPVLRINYVYSTKGDTSSISPGVISRTHTLEETLQGCLPGAEVETKFWGTRELFDASQSLKSYTLPLQYTESYISTGENNYEEFIDYLLE